MAPAPDGLVPDGKKQGKPKMNLQEDRALKGGFRTGEKGLHNEKRRTSVAVGVTAPGMEDPEKAAISLRADGALLKPTNVIFTDRLPFNIFVTVTTVLNVVCMGLEQDLSTNTTAAIWTFLEYGFLGCFVLELFIRAGVLRKFFFIDLWNMADCLLVILACLDEFFLKPAGVGGQLRFFLVFRVLRIVRVVQLVRTYSFARELWLLAGGLTSSMKALGWVALVLIVALYVGAIIVTAQIGQNDAVYGAGASYDGQVWPYREYFGTVPRSMFTLFQVITLDGWVDDILRHVVYRQPLFGIFFIMFMVIMAFGVMNVIVGIIVENTLTAAQVIDRRIEDQERSKRQAAVSDLYAILEKSDSKRSGTISLEDLRAATQSRVVQDKFEMLDLTFEEVEQVVKLLDAQQNGRIELKRLATALTEMVGGAKRRDMAQVEVSMGSLALRLDRLDANFASMEAEVKIIASMTDAFVNNTVRFLTGFDAAAAEGDKAGKGH